MINPFRTGGFIGCITLAVLLAGCESADVDPARASAAAAMAPLPTGRFIDPASAESSQGVASMPVNVVLSNDGRYAISSAAGFREHLCCVRVSDGRKVGDLEFAATRGSRGNGLYYGLAFGPDGKLYAAMGAAGKIAVVTLGAEGTLALDRELATGPNDFPAGIALDSAGRIYVTQNDPTSRDSAFGSPASVSIHDAGSGQELGRFVFKDDVGLSNFPLALTVNRDGSRVYVGSERDDAVYVLDASDPGAIAVRARLATGSHPLALLLNKAQSELFVANAQSDTITIVDTGSEKIIHTILLRPDIARNLAGATPTGLALAPDERTLYATLGDMNAVAVIDLAESGGPKLEGYIPAGWYPTAVAATAQHLLVTNAKGDVGRIPHDFATGKTVTSPLNLFEGTLWRVGIPGRAQLEGLTEQCLRNARLTPQCLAGKNPLQAISRQAGKIQHVIYVIKENRTYDQVLGDLPQGNGDTARCLFPREVTPNLHALAERFILLDNFYDSGDVSGDGWTWSTQAQANEYTIRNVPYNYSNRGRSYDTEGSNNKYPTGGFPALGPDSRPLSNDPRFKDGAQAVPDVAASAGGHLWDLARRHELSYRNYGFFVTEGVDKSGKVIIPDNYPASAGVQPGGHDLDGITDVDFRRFDLDFPDSDAPGHYAAMLNDPSLLWAKSAYGKAGRACRFEEWKREFDLMVGRDPSGASIPNLMTIRLGTDHTQGASAGKPTPRCMVADNDFAVGQLVEAVSHSAIWNSCAIIIVEDDAQNGPDHVDAHRSTCYIISPWMRRQTVDHSFQNTISAVRTIESLLNLPPMCQYDASSGIIGGWDSAPRNSAPYGALLPSAEIMKERNPRRATAAGAAAGTPSGTVADLSAARRLATPEDLEQASDEMDFSKADQAPAELLNRIIWKSVRGIDSEAPPTPHALTSRQAAPVADHDD